MKKLILQADKECYFCGKKTGLHQHEIFFGSANRKKSIEYGLQVWLCPEHHNMSSNGVHMNHKKDIELKRQAQKVFESQFGHEEFMKIFHKNYLKGDEDGI